MADENLPQSAPSEPVPEGTEFSQQELEAIRVALPLLCKRYPELKPLLEQLIPHDPIQKVVEQFLEEEQHRVQNEIETTVNSDQHTETTRGHSATQVAITRDPGDEPAGTGWLPADMASPEERQ